MNEPMIYLCLGTIIGLILGISRYFIRKNSLILKEIRNKDEIFINRIGKLQEQIDFQNIKLNFLYDQLNNKTIKTKQKTKK
ncbi:MAG: hypothetical protein WC679_13405, partial [Bacteroidales bacterium]|jgi:hypothetical protein